MDPSKALITCSAGVVLGGISAVIWTAVDNHKKTKKQENTKGISKSIISSFETNSTKQRIETNTDQRNEKSHSFTTGITKTEGSDVFTYPDIIRIDKRLINSLEVLRHARNFQEKEFWEIVASITRIQNLWWRTANSNPEHLQATTPHKATQLMENTKSAMEAYCRSASIALHDTKSGKFRYSPVNPNYRPAYTQILTSADNMRHNVIAMYDKMRAKKLKNDINNNHQKKLNTTTQ